MGTSYRTTIITILFFNLCAASAAHAELFGGFLRRIFHPNEVARFAIPGGCPLQRQQIGFNQDFNQDFSQFSRFNGGNPGFANAGFGQQGFCPAGTFFQNGQCFRLNQFNQFGQQGQFGGELQDPGQFGQNQIFTPGFGQQQGFGLGQGLGQNGLLGANQLGQGNQTSNFNLNGGPSIFNNVTPNGNLGGGRLGIGVPGLPAKGTQPFVILTNFRVTPAYQFSPHLEVIGRRFVVNGQPIWGSFLFEVGDGQAPRQIHINDATGAVSGITNPVTLLELRNFLASPRQPGGLPRWRLYGNNPQVANYWKWSKPSWVNLSKGDDKFDRTQAPDLMKVGQTLFALGAADVNGQRSLVPLRIDGKNQLSAPDAAVWDDNAPLSKINQELKQYYAFKFKHGLMKNSGKAVTAFNKKIFNYVWPHLWIKDDGTVTAGKDKKPFIIKPDGRVVGDVYPDTIQQYLKFVNGNKAYKRRNLTAFQKFYGKPKWINKEKYPHLATVGEGKFKALVEIGPNGQRQIAINKDGEVVWNEVPETSDEVRQYFAWGKKHHLFDQNPAAQKIIARVEKHYGPVDDTDGTPSDDYQLTNDDSLPPAESGIPTRVAQREMPGNRMSDVDPDKILPPPPIPQPPAHGDEGTVSRRIANTDVLGHGTHVGKHPWARMTAVSHEQLEPASQAKEIRSALAKIGELTSLGVSDLLDRPGEDARDKLLGMVDPLVHRQGSDKPLEHALPGPGFKTREELNNVVTKNPNADALPKLSTSNWSGGLKDAFQQSIESSHVGVKKGNDYELTAANVANLLLATVPPGMPRPAALPGFEATANSPVLTADQWDELGKHIGDLVLSYQKALQSTHN